MPIVVRRNPGTCSRELPDQLDLARGASVVPEALVLVGQRTVNRVTRGSIVSHLRKHATNRYPLSCIQRCSVLRPRGRRAGHEHAADPGDQSRLAAQTGVVPVEMIIDFPGGARVDAHFAGFVVPTDQPPTGGGEGSAPTPLATFLSTIGTCAGIYVLGFCRQRGISTDGIRLVQRMAVDPATRLVSDVQVTIELPETFPAKYADAVVRSAEQCAVKKHFEHPPVIRVDSTIAVPA
jgi:putative redox protein